MSQDDEIVLPEVKIVRGNAFQRHTILGRVKGERVKYVWKKRPYVHQKDAVKKLLSNGWGGALLMEPRTGKTKVVVDYASILHQAGRVNRVLVFCPVGVMGVWPDQIKDNCPFPHRATVWDRRSRKDTPLPKFGSSKLDFVIVNYDALSTAGKIVGKDDDGNIKRSRKRGGRYDIRRQLKAWDPQLVVLDESHRIKSPSAVKSATVHRFREVPYRVIMTGTPRTKKKRAFDIYSQWKFLNWDRFNQMNFAEFKSQFCVFTRRNGYPQFLKNLNEGQLHRLVHMDSFSIRRDQCFDLPALTAQIIPVELEESADVYDQMAEDMVAKIKSGEITEASIRLVQGLRLQQISCGITTTIPTLEHPKGQLRIIGSEKLRVILSRLEDLLEADEKVIVGAHFRADIRRLAEGITKLGVEPFVVRGGVDPKLRVPMAKEFERRDGPQVWIANPGAASEGIELASASIMLWYSLPRSWVNFKQFSDRNALSHKPRFVEYYLASPYEHGQLANLREDGDIARWMITSPEQLLRERSS